MLDPKASLLSESARRCDINVVSWTEHWVGAHVSPSMLLKAIVVSMQTGMPIPSAPTPRPAAIHHSLTCSSRLIQHRSGKRGGQA